MIEVSQCKAYRFEKWWDTEGRFLHPGLYHKLLTTYLWMRMKPVVKKGTILNNYTMLNYDRPESQQDLGKRLDVDVTTARKYIKIIKTFVTDETLRSWYINWAIYNPTAHMHNMMEGYFGDKYRLPK